MAFDITAGSGKTISADVYGSAHDVSGGEQTQIVALASGTLGALALATPANPVPIRNGIVDLISVTCVLDTSIYASGDLLVDTQAIAAAVRVSSGSAELVSLTAIDEDDQGVAFDVYVTSSSSSWGTFNVAPTITDTVARSVQAIIPIASGDWKDLGGVRVANIKNIGAICKASGSTSLYVAVVNGSGTPTFTASGVKLVFGFKQN